MGADFPPSSAKLCLESLGILTTSPDRVDKCANSEEGSLLLLNYGEETLSLDPELTGVPWLLFNDVIWIKFWLKNILEFVLYISRSSQWITGLMGWMIWEDYFVHHSLWNLNFVNNLLRFIVNYIDSSCAVQYWMKMNKVILFLLVVVGPIVLCQDIFNVASVLDTETNKTSVKLSVYYESLCSTSIWFVISQLFPSWEHFGQDTLQVDLHPFGKANVRWKIVTLLEMFLCKFSQNAAGGWDFVCQHGPRECHANKIQVCILDQVNRVVGDKRRK